MWTAKLREVGLYNSRRAVATGVMAARIAGRRPPTIPVASAKKIPLTSKSGVTLKANARLENISKFIVDVVRPSSDTRVLESLAPLSHEMA
jgi:hypothetical protein